MTNEVFKRAMFLEMSNYTSDHRGCVRQAVREIIPEYELVDTYTLYGITYDDYIDDMSVAYLRYKYNEMSKKENNVI